MKIIMRTVLLRRSRRSQIVGERQHHGGGDEQRRFLDEIGDRHDGGAAPECEGGLAASRRQPARPDYRMRLPVRTRFVAAGMREIPLDPRTNRRCDPRRQPDRAGHEPRLLRPRRKLSARAGRAATTSATGCASSSAGRKAASPTWPKRYGKLTGHPGIAFVTRGPGASNAAIGIHTAAQDSTPMIVFVGQVGGDFVDREAFQEIDYRRMYGSVAKWAAQIDRAERIPEYRRARLPRGA